MKLDCGPTSAERIAAIKEWHDWFAWHPVRLRTADRSPSSRGGSVFIGFTDTRDCRWLETIERRGFMLPTGEFGFAEWHFEYRAKESA